MNIRISRLLKENGKLIVLTFEIFWILIFMLERISGANSAVVPQFIYVNF